MSSLSENHEDVNIERYSFASVRNIRFAAQEDRKIEYKTMYKANTIHKNYTASETALAEVTRKAHEQ